MKSDFKIGDELITYGIIKIFEKESKMAKSIKDLKYFIAKLVIIGIIYFFIMCYIQKYTVFALFFIIICSLLIFFYVYQNAGKIYYLNSKNLGGKTTNLLKNKTKWKLYNATVYNSKLMKREDIRILRKILKVNQINNVECMKELKNYFAENEKKVPIEIGRFTKDTLSLFLIPITFGIVGIYPLVNNNLATGQNIIDIAYIIFISFIVLGFLLVLYIVFAIRSFSVTDAYIYPRVKELLVQFIIEKGKNKKYEH